MNTPQKRKYLSTFQLIMIAIVSVDSLRNLPIGAQYGLSLVTFYILAGLAFFLPLTFVASQLAKRFPNVGGSYVWVEAAFGKKSGYLSIWLQWTYNIIWYPTIFAFISSTLASLIDPDLANNRWFILTTCICFFWLLTFLHSYGVKAIAWISTTSAIIGTLFPMLLITALAIYWVASGTPSATPLAATALLPSKETLKDIAYFSNILFSLVGIEVIAMHAGNVANPQKSYPRALIISAFIILITLVLSSLALCIVIPPGKIMLLSGVMDVFALFFAAHHFPLGTKIIGWCIVIGSLGIASSWMIGIARGLHVALTKSKLPKTLHKLNKHEVPVNILYLQGLVYTLLLSAFLLLPNVNNSYWLLSALASQFSLLYYVLLFSAAFKLFRGSPSRNQRREDDSSPAMKTPRTILGILLPASGSIISLAGIIVGFIPPSNIPAGNILQYKLFMLAGLIIFCLLPFLFLRKIHLVNSTS